MDQRVIATAIFIQEMDKLFDSFNGRNHTSPPGKELKCVITTKLPHMAYWNEAYSMIDSWTFRRTTVQGYIKMSRPPSQIGWLISLKAIKQIWEHLSANKILLLCDQGLCSKTVLKTVLEVLGLVVVVVIIQLQSNLLAA